MADSADKGVFTEQMPAPPPFWQHFTPENTARVEDIQQRGAEVPQELHALVSPAPPVDGKYRSFGGSYNIYESLPRLEEQGQERLYPESPKLAAEDKESKTKSEWTHDRAFHLQNVLRSILLNFLELIGSLSQDATQADPKLNDLENLFVNAFQIINEYRPHQARETLILMMEKQVAQRKCEIQLMKEMKDKINGLATSDVNPNSNLQHHSLNGVVRLGDQEAEVKPQEWEALVTG